MSYSSEVLADSPLAYYHLGESAGETVLVDSSGNGRDGTYTGVTLGASSLVPSMSDTAATFAGGATSYAQRSSAGLQPETITVEFWFKPSSVSGTKEIIGRAQSGAVQNFNYSWRIVQINATLYCRICVNGSGTTATCQTGNVLSATAAKHCVFTFDGANMRWYVDGTLAATTARSGTLNGGIEDLFIGRSADTSNAGAGGVYDEVALYGTALSSTRISAHYTAGTTVTTSGTLTGSLPPLTASLSGTSALPTASGVIAAVLPPLGASLVGETHPPGIAGDLTATLPPLGASLAGAYSDTATLAVILPPLSANLTGTYSLPPVTGSLAATLPALRSTIAGQSFKPGTEGYLEAVLPGLSAALSGDVLGRNGFGLALDSTATLTVLEQVDTTTLPTPTGTPGVPATVLHIIAPTVPAPTLVNGRPQ